MNRSYIPDLSDYRIGVCALCGKLLVTKTTDEDSPCPFCPQEKRRLPSRVLAAIFFGDFDEEERPLNATLEVYSNEASDEMESAMVHEMIHGLKIGGGRFVRDVPGAVAFQTVYEWEKFHRILEGVRERSFQGGQETLLQYLDFHKLVDVIFQKYENTSSEPLESYAEGAFVAGIAVNLFNKDASRYIRALIHTLDSRHAALCARNSCFFDRALALRESSYWSGDEFLLDKFYRESEKVLNRIEIAGLLDLIFSKLNRVPPVELPLRWPNDYLRDWILYYKTVGDPFRLCLATFRLVMNGGINGREAARSLYLFQQASHVALYSNTRHLLLLDDMIQALKSKLKGTSLEEYAKHVEKFNLETSRQIAQELEHCRTSLLAARRLAE